MVVTETAVLGCLGGDPIPIGDIMQRLGIQDHTPEIFHLVQILKDLIQRWEITCESREGGYKYYSRKQAVRRLKETSIETPPSPVQTQIQPKIPPRKPTPEERQNSDQDLLLRIVKTHNLGSRDDIERIATYLNAKLNPLAFDTFGDFSLNSLEGLGGFPLRLSMFGDITYDDKISLVSVLIYYLENINSHGISAEEIEGLRLWRVELKYYKILEHSSTFLNTRIKRVEELQEEALGIENSEGIMQKLSELHARLKDQEKNAGSEKLPRLQKGQVTCPHCWHKLTPGRSPFNFKQRVLKCVECDQLFEDPNEEAKIPRKLREVFNDSSEADDVKREHTRRLKRDFANSTD